METEKEKFYKQLEADRKNGLVNTGISVDPSYVGSLTKESEEAFYAELNRMEEAPSMRKVLEQIDKEEGLIDYKFGVPTHKPNETLSEQGVTVDDLDRDLGKVLMSENRTSIDVSTL